MEIKDNISLKEFTTFKIGGNARFFSVARDAGDYRAAASFARKEKIPLLPLGGGSNVLISDDGFPGLVLKSDILGLDFKDLGRGVYEVAVGAGENWDDFVALTVEKGLVGLENLSGIPGLVGASPVQNIGAYGAEVKDSIAFVEVYDQKEDEFVILSPGECKFGYRDSIFKTPKGKNFIVSRIGFRLKKDGKLNLTYKDLANHFKNRKTVPALLEVREVVLKVRSGKFPNLKEFGTAGSFFKNPIVTEDVYKELVEKFPDLPSFPAGRRKIKLPLGWILEHVCNFKGTRRGKVGAYEKQALVIVNYGEATFSDVKNFSEEIEKEVFEKTGLKIEREVQIVDSSFVI